MKKKDLVPLFRRLLPDLPGFVFHKRLLLRSPITDLLQGIHFETNGWDEDGFNVDAFVMPLCVPDDDIHLTFGVRVENPNSVWTMSMPDLAAKMVDAIHGQAIPFLEQRATLLDFAEHMAWRNPHAPKAAAYAFARAGETTRAVSTIDRLLPMLDLKVDWERTIAEDVVGLRTILLETPRSAQAKLAEWEQYTVRKLGLEAFR